MGNRLRQSLEETMRLIISANPSVLGEKKKKKNMERVRLEVFLTLPDQRKNNN